MQYQQAVHAVQPAGCLKLYLRVTRCTLDAGLHVSMGVWQNFINALGVGSKKVCVLVVGLDNGGKSTIVNRLKPKAAQSQEMAPTVGFAVEQVKKGGLNLTVIDMSGASRYRSLWEKYFADAEAIIFVVDSSDRLRLIVAQNELSQVLQHQQMSLPLPLLVLANKQDLDGALPPSELAQSLQLDSIRDRPWQIIATNALTGDGLDAATDWLAESLIVK